VGCLGEKGEFLEELVVVGGGGIALFECVCVSVFFEAKRSGRLPSGQRVRWRDHSALTDG
jgi:hypothetical protein